MLIATVLLLLAAPVSAPCDTPGVAREDTRWKRVEHQDGVIVYTPPDESTRSMRFEYLLPSGETIVDDRSAGLAVRVEMREQVDWDSLAPSGGELQEEDVQRRAAAGECFVVFRYQDCVSDGEVTRSVLRSVEEYAGRRMVRVNEPNLEVPVPQHLAGMVILRKDE